MSFEYIFFFKRSDCDILVLELLTFLDGASESFERSERGEGVLSSCFTSAFGGIGDLVTFWMGGLEN